MSAEIKTHPLKLPTPIAIVGMGKSGEAAKRLLLAAGVEAKDFFTFDQKQPGANYSDPEKLFKEVAPKTLVVSPGVPLASPWIQKALSEGAFLTSETSLACQFLTSEKMIGVTGSVGKSTTVSLLGQGLSNFSKSYFVGGNLGTPFSDYAADLLLGLRKKADWVVLELSSYQLENCDGLQLDYSGITYLTANHLERYPSLLEYYETKWKILGITKHKLVLNSQGGDLASFSADRDPEKVVYSDRQSERMLRFSLPSAKLIGDHNQDNLALAIEIALHAGWPEESIMAMKDFRGLAHRLEYVDEVRGIRFVNDSKATAIDSVLIAVEAAAASRTAGNLFVLLGGRDKNLPWLKLMTLKEIPQIHFIFFGECRQIAQNQSKLPGPSFAHLKEALDHCLMNARANDTVLLSPGGTSLDEFKSFEERGDFFKSQIQLFAKA